MPQLLKLTNLSINCFMSSQIMSDSFCKEHLQQLNYLSANPLKSLINCLIVIKGRSEKQVFLSVGIYCICARVECKHSKTRRCLLLLPRNMISTFIYNLNVCIKNCINMLPVCRKVRPHFILSAREQRRTAKTMRTM